MHGEVLGHGRAVRSGARPRQDRAGAAAGDVVPGDSYCCSLTSSCGPRGSAPGVDTVVLRRRKPIFRQGRGSLIVPIRPHWKTQAARLAGRSDVRPEAGAVTAPRTTCPCVHLGVPGSGTDLGCDPHKCTHEHIHGHRENVPPEMATGSASAAPRCVAPPGGPWRPQPRRRAPRNLDAGVSLPSAPSSPGPSRAGHHGGIVTPAGVAVANDRPQPGR